MKQFLAKSKIYNQLFDFDGFHLTHCCCLTIDIVERINEMLKEILKLIYRCVCIYKKYIFY